MQDTVEKYKVLKKLGKELFAQSDVAKVGNVSSDDIEIAKEFLKRAITATNPGVLSLYFEHIIIAPELGKRIVDALGDKSYELGVRREEVEFLLWLHEIGRLVDPAEYLRNDLIEEHLLKDFGIPEELINQMPPIETMLKVVQMMNLQENQIQGQEKLNSEQEKIARDYFYLLSPTQKLIFFADKKKKKSLNGDIFNFERYITYLRTYATNYPNSEFSDEIRGTVILTIYIIEKTISWFEALGLSYEAILDGLQNYGPKFVIVARHGIFLNPSGLIYSTDFVMKKYNKEIIHLNPKGKEQMSRLGQLVKKRKFRVKQIISSPSARAVESADSLNQAFNLNNLQMNDNLDDVYVPGPVAEGMTMEEHQRLGGGSVYVDTRWASYGHETPDKIVKRLQSTFETVSNNLKTGETTILVSHGDPIAWWINHQVTGTIPDPKILRNLIYPNKGDAVVVILDPQGEWFSHYILKDASLIEGESY